MLRVLLDTGPLVALFAQTDQHHQSCVEQLKTIRAPLVTCWPVLTEAAWLLRRQPSAIKGMLSGLQEGFLTLATLDADDIAPIQAILSRYREIGAQLADAAIVRLAEREGLDTIFTLDRRDFSVYRMTSGKPLRIIPG